MYLDGNSLGPLPKNALAAAHRVMDEEWGGELIRAWNTADWMGLPVRVGNQIAGLIGAQEGTVATGDTLSIKVYQALAAALRMRRDRKIILSDDGNFPTDLYMAEGLIDTLQMGHRLQTPPPDKLAEAITSDVAAVMLTHVDYRTGRMHDMEAITRQVHDAGAVMIWDLAHSAGAVPLDLAASGAEFAVGCTYKYLNGGPGAPAFIYARADIVTTIVPALAGWMGHDAPFAMERSYRPAMSTERLRVGTPPIIQLTVLQEALRVWDEVDIDEVRKASTKLTAQFIDEIERRAPALRLVTPRAAELRGSQVSFAFENGYAAMQALIDRGVIGDFRAPNIMRFGFTPLYIDEQDVIRAADVIEAVIGQEIWRDPKYQNVSRVT